jgi:hypothetical protein
VLHSCIAHTKVHLEALEKPFPTDEAIQSCTYTSNMQFTNIALVILEVLDAEPALDWCTE